jgi:hypothetical protein
MPVPDGPWKARLDALRKYDWSAPPTGQRDLAASFFCAHPDSAVREAICSALAEWGDTDRLLVLAHDPMTVVRMSAVYYLHAVPPSRQVADLAWDLIASGQLASTRGQEALRTYTAHTPEEESRDRLHDMAVTDRRESIRYEAVHLLGGNIDASVLALLGEPPLVTWSVHSMLLTICAREAIQPPPIGHLDEIDNLRVAEDLAYLVA